MRSKLVPLSHMSVCWLIVMVGVMGAAHITQLPVWAIFASVLMMGWAWLSNQGRFKQTKAAFKHVIIAIMIIAILFSAATADGLAGLSTLLVVGSALKLLETQTRRDGWVLIYTCCFGTAVSFLFNQTMFTAAGGLLSIVVIFSALVSMHSAGGSIQGWDHTAGLSMIKRSSALLLQSLPMMIILFIVFPRFGPLWSVEYKNSAATTGLSETISPGQIGRLARSADIAFRVSFTDKQPPAREDRYWRAMTFERYDGEKWLLDDSIGRPVNFQPDPEPITGVEYQVIAEPSANPWLFLLDYPVSVSMEGIQRLNNRTIRSTRPLDSRKTYTAISQVTDQYSEVSLAANSSYLQLPATGNLKTRELVGSWVVQGMSTQDIITQIQRLFHRSFQYTLSPPIIKGDQIDGFIFDTQAGFCEHFASSAAFMLRLAGIPTRLVGGYLGGEWNEYESYMLVRQYEAHAWVEYWLDGKGWQRFDPTASVAPERIDQSFDSVFGNEPEFAADSFMPLIRFDKKWAWLGDARLRYDAINYRWHKWVLGYHENQQTLLENLLTGKNYLTFVAAVVVPVALVLGVTLYWLLRRNSIYQDKRSRHVERVSLCLSKKDKRLKRKKGETLRRFIQRVTVYFPELNELAEKWLVEYERLEYSPFSMDDKAYLDAYRAFYRKVCLMRKLAPQSEFSPRQKGTL